MADRYWSRGMQGDVAEHATADEARAAAEEELELARQYGWPSEAEHIAWGEVVEAASPDGAGGYELRPVAAGRGA